MRKIFDVFMNLHTRMDEKLYNRLNNAAFMQKKSKAEIVRLALEKYLDELNIA